MLTGDCSRCMFHSIPPYLPACNLCGALAALCALVRIFKAQDGADSQRPPRCPTQYHHFHLCLAAGGERERSRRQGCN